MTKAFPDMNTYMLKRLKRDSFIMKLSLFFAYFNNLYKKQKTDCIKIQACPNATIFSDKDLSFVQTAYQSGFLPCSGILVQNALGSSLVNLLNSGLNNLTCVIGLSFNCSVSLFNGGMQSRTISLVAKIISLTYTDTLLCGFNIRHCYTSKIYSSKSIIPQPAEFCNTFFHIFLNTCQQYFQVIHFEY